MLSDPLSTSLVLGIALILGIFLWVSLFRFPIIPIIITFTIFALYAILDTEVISFEIGVFNINILDILSAIIISIGIIRLIFYPKKITVEMIFIFLLGFLLFSSWLRGTLIYNLETATNSFRTYFYFYSTLFYTATLKPTVKVTRQIIMWIEITAGVIILLAIIRWFMIVMGVISKDEWLAPNGSMTRVLTSPATLLILQSMILLYFSNNSKRNLFQIITASLVITTIVAILQQRTIWVALLISFFVAILLKSKFKNLVILSILFCMAICTLILVLNNFSIDNLIGTAFDLRNLNWRFLGWESLLTSSRIHSPIDFLIGQPFGTGYDRYILNSVYETTVSPHNFYIQTFLNIGLIGVISFLSIYVMVFKKLWQNRAFQTNQCLIVLITSQIIFYLTYAPNFEQGIFMGLVLLYLQYHSENQHIQTTAEFNLANQSIK